MTQHIHSRTLHRPLRRWSSGRSGASGPLGLSAWRITVAATLACAAILGIFVVDRHTIGSEIWGPITAAIGITAGLLTLVVGRHLRRRSVLATIVLLWLVVAALGVSGTMDHAASVLPEYIDQRPRPQWLPLIFTAIGGAAIAAAVRLARHHRVRRPTDREDDR